MTITIRELIDKITRIKELRDKGTREWPYDPSTETKDEWELNSLLSTELEEVEREE